MSPTCGPVDVGHLLDADREDEARALGGDRVQALIDRGRAGGAGILDPRRALEAQRRIELQHQRGGKFLAREAAIEGAEINLVDVGGRDAGILQRVARDADDERFDILALELAEFRMGPSDDAGGHARPPSQRSRA